MTGFLPSVAPATRGPGGSMQTGSVQTGSVQTGWGRSLAEAVRSSAELLQSLGLPPAIGCEDSGFPVLVPRSFVRRMRRGDPNDPLLRQVLATAAERAVVPGFAADAVGDGNAMRAAGLIHKYRGRALLVATGACAVHCRYCFRRHFPYGEQPKRLDDWRPALETIAADQTIREVILSGGDPLMLTDRRLGDLLDRLEAIPHLRRLRLHTRLPIVLPDRVTGDLLDRLRRSRLQVWVVVHANHARELVDDCAAGLRRLVRSGLPTLNQAVWLRGVNDTAADQSALCESLIDLGVQPYYLHLLDRVAGAAHFEADHAAAVAAIDVVRRRLPGYAVPTVVREIAGEPSKTPVQ